MTSPVDYAEKGYAVLPCWWIKDDGACACGNAACHAKGKHPINSLVPRGVLDASRDPAVVAGWLSKVPLANWGLAMGMNGLIAVDIDPRNGGDATWEALIIKYGEPPETWTARTGGGGTHLIFALPDGMSVPGKWGNGIDLKHGNGYVLVEPSRTQAAYCWLDDLSPLEDAPLAEFIGFPKEDEEAAPVKNVVRMVDSATLADLRAALAWLDSDRRDTWIKVGHALRQLGPAGFALWNEWSQLSGKYRPDDQVKRWAGFSPTEINLETIFFDAQQAGWPGKPLSSVSQSQPVREVAEAPKGFDAPAPVPMLDELAAWLGGDPETARAAAISLAAFAASRRYESEEGDPTHLYLMAISESIDELRPTLHQYARLLHQAGLRRHLRESRIATPAAIDRILRRCPATVWLSDEYATGVAYSKRQPAGTLEQAFGMMTSLYGKRFFQLEATSDAARADAETEVVHCPALSIFAAAAHADVAQLVRVSEISRGAFGQMLMVQSAQNISDPSRDPAPLWLVTHLRSLRGLPAEFSEFSPPSTVFAEAPGVEPAMVRATFQTSPDIHWPSFRSLTQARPLQALLRSAWRNMRRISVALAAWANPSAPVVTTSILEWSAGYVLHHLREQIDAAQVLGNEDGKTTVEQKVLDFIRKAGPNGATKKEIHMGCHAFRLMKSATERNDVLAHLIEDEAIEQAQIRLVSATRPRNVYRIVGWKVEKVEESCDAPSTLQSQSTQGFATEG